MSFRREQEAELDWNRWVLIHQAELIALGIPREVWADRFTWLRFLEHSHHPPSENVRDVRWRLADLSTAQQRNFYRFLTRCLTEHERAGNCVWMTLHHQYGVEVAEPGE